MEGKNMKRASLWLGVSVCVVAIALGTTFRGVPTIFAGVLDGWPQWGQNQQHQGFVPTPGQAATSVLADTIYDPFTAAEERDAGGTLLVHYQVPLLEGNDVFMEFKTGRFIECDPVTGNPPPGETDCGQSAWTRRSGIRKGCTGKPGN